MVAVAVSAGFVVADDEVGVFAAQDVGQLGCGVVGVGACESGCMGWVGGDGGAGAGVCVAESDDVVGADGCCAAVEFVDSGGAEVAVVVVAGVGFAEFTIGGHDEDDAVSCSGCFGEGACHEECFVVGVGVDGDDGAAHIGQCVIGGWRGLVACGGMSGVAGCLGAYCFGFGCFFAASGWD